MRSPMAATAVCAWYTARRPALSALAQRRVEKDIQYEPARFDNVEATPNRAGDRD